MDQRSDAGGEDLAAVPPSSGEQLLMLLVRSATLVFLAIAIGLMALLYFLATLATCVSGPIRWACDAFARQSGREITAKL